MMKQDEVVLSYGDVLLRKSDLELLHGPFYLNDSLIEFCFAHLSSRCPPSMLFVAPALSFWIVHWPDAASLHSSVDPLSFPQRQVVMFTVNNNEDVDLAGGGTHWSLLVYDRNRNIFEHYDSISGLNSRIAKKLVSIIKPFMGSDAASAKLKEAWTPQQENGYDCGVYVMAIAEALYHACQDEGMVSNEHTTLLRDQVTPDSVSKMRHRTHELIITLSKESRS